jgi:hypothetical protein
LEPKQTEESFANLAAVRERFIGLLLVEQQGAELHHPDGRRDRWPVTKQILGVDK